MPFAEDFIPTRHSLLSRLKDLDDQTSWRDFFDTYWRLIYSVARKSGLTEDQAQEVVQDTVVTVSRRIQDFHYDPERGSFKSWLLCLTRSRIIDQVRKRQARGGGLQQVPFADESSRTPMVERVADPAGFALEAEWDQEWEQNLIDTATERVKSRVSPEYYQLFDLHVMRHWPALRVARRFGVNLGKVYFAKYKVSSMIKREIDRLEREMV